MGKILCYIYEDMADFEISVLLHRLRNMGGKEICSISETLDPVTAQSGLIYMPERTISDITSLDMVEALIIPGGPINNQQNTVCPLARAIVDEGKLLAAICFAPQFAGRAGILAQYHYTTSCSEEKIRQLGCEDPFDRGNYVEKRVVVDRNLITAQGYAFVDFAVEVCRYLKILKKKEQEYEWFGRIKEIG